MPQLQTSSATITPLRLELKQTPTNTQSVVQENGTLRLNESSGQSNPVNKTASQTGNTQILQTQARKNNNNPLYTTSNSMYGSKKASEIHRPSEYFGSSHSFSKEFVGGMFRNHSLNTNRTRNIALPDPTFGANHYHEQ
ncbi:hypothetical protein FDP41_008902 [Naegleria fowleri]|uniref:Uncharacterized protein n=1 Tax=Naegleria fowleri TaxID=5763 RepID=A0A6A5AYY4_NAEFO|nr:uncharacterized protein FDP41_008902 [Naegleria fowleri]KAF0972653.1 hypothetical protein FDP41_008902 [Naegleria fowleri]CAG4710139.1 unnamed protein product [Naegleria fowleri]